jgi:hypothetical protein
MWQGLKRAWKQKHNQGHDAAYLVERVVFVGHEEGEHKRDAAFFLLPCAGRGRPRRQPPPRRQLPSQVT